MVVKNKEHDRDQKMGIIERIACDLENFSAKVADEIIHRLTKKID